MAKKKAAQKNAAKERQIKEKALKEKPANESKKEKTGYLWAMSYAPPAGEGRDGPQMIPLIFFTAVVILFVRATVYERPMDAFYWSNSGNEMIEFFSHFKMTMILLCAAVALLMLLYRFVTQTFLLERSIVYIPMLVYLACVILSHVFSEYKEFALLGWNDRFEGTLVVISYLVMLFFAINTIQTERGIRWMVYAVAGSSVLLGLLGLSQALDRDFFATTIGRMMILPRAYWDIMDHLEFKFTAREIYQTVYNINYVSFYLALLVPLFGLLFIYAVMKGKAGALWVKITWGFLFALAMYNLVGSMSSGGYLGIAVAVAAAFVLLNKRIIAWRKPVLLLLGITIVIGAITYDRWTAEMSSALRGVRTPAETVQTSGSSEPDPNRPPHIDYFNVLSADYTIALSVEGNEVVFVLGPPGRMGLDVDVRDSDGKEIELHDRDENGLFRLDDERFSMVAIAGTEGQGAEARFIINTVDRDWIFMLTQAGVFYQNDLGNITALLGAEAIGWENNQRFGSGRGYIWSRTLPLIKGTLIIGHGADTYCAYFPHNDYVGKYNAGMVRTINAIVDKPHNMYMGMAVGTGLLSVLAFLAILILYGTQTVRLLWKRSFDGFAEYTAAGILLGIVGFAVAGLVNDSSVSVMPLFYGLLGTGLALNTIIKRETGEN